MRSDPTNDVSSTTIEFWQVMFAREKDKGTLIDSRVYIRKVESGDKKELLNLAQTSVVLHSPWISPPITPHTFKLYFKRTQRDDHEGLVCCLRESGDIVGVINLNSIERGSFLSATLGYYVGSKYAGQGLMTEALNLVAKFAFDNLGLHRIEANIQPSNLPSKRLVQKCGFVQEGYSQDYLYINGQWRDHERWALVHSRQNLTR